MWVGLTPLSLGAGGCWRWQLACSPDLVLGVPDTYTHTHIHTYPHMHIAFMHTHTHTHTHTQHTHTHTHSTAHRTAVH